MANQLDVNVQVAVQGAENLDRVGGQFEQAQTSASKFGTVAQGAMIGVASAVTGFGIGLAEQGISSAIDAIGNSISLASDKAEAANKAQVVFGASYDDVAKAAEGAAVAVGMSSGAYLDAAGTVGNLVNSMGLSKQASAGMSESVVQLAADLGSFNNVPTADALDAIQSAFTGQVRPMRQFGVMLDQATIQSKAMAMGLYDGKGALDASARAQAVYQLILESTSNAQGDFARTSSGLANEQKIAQAKMDDSLENLGAVLYPIAQTLVPMFADALSTAVGWITSVAQGIQGWLDANQPLVQSIESLIGTLAELYGKYLSWVFGILGQIWGAVTQLTDVLSGPFNAAWDLVAQTIGFFIGVLGEAGNALNNVHRFLDPNFAALDDLGNSFRAAGEAAGLSSDQIDQAWASAQASAKAGGDASTMSMDQYIASWKATNVAATDASSAAATTANDWQDASDRIGAASTTMVDQVASGVQGVGFDLFAFARDAMAKVQTLDWLHLGQTIPGDIGKGIADSSHAVLDAADHLVQLLKDGLSPAEQAAKLEGQKYTKAVAAGMTSEIPGARQAAEETAVQAIKAIESAANGTPNTKGLKAIGSYYDSLLAGGMDDHAVAVALAGAGVAADTIQKLTGYYPDFDATGKAYDAHIATGVAQADGQISTAVSNATDPMSNVPAEHYGTSVGNAWVDGAAGAVRSGQSDIAAAAFHAFQHLIGQSPPATGPLHEIDRWGANVGGAWIDGATDGIIRGRDGLTRALGGVFPGALSSGASSSGPAAGASAAGGVTVNVYAGVGDPVAIGRQVAQALAAYERASGTQTLA